MTSWTRELPPDGSSPGTARRWLREQLASNASSTEVELADLELCLSELVSNAVLHAGTDCRVQVTLRSGRVRVAISDGDTRRLPTMQAYDETAVTGRGLHLVERLSARWGVEIDADTKTVWFEIDRTPAADGTAPV